jgi:signal transduction histidine kinase
LLDNAIKFTPDGGTIRLSAMPYFWERRTVRELIHNPQERRGTLRSNGFNSVRVVVSDTGVGVPAEFLHDIFEEYSRVSNDSATPRGFGLGLGIARRIILAHEGKIWAESQPGQGSTFTVLLPITA